MSEAQILATPPRFTTLDWAVVAALAVVAVLIGVLWWNVDTLFDRVDEQHKLARDARAVVAGLNEQIGAKRGELQALETEYDALKAEYERLKAARDSLPPVNGNPEPAVPQPAPSDTPLNTRIAQLEKDLEQIKAERDKLQVALDDLRRSGGDTAQTVCTALKQRIPRNDHMLLRLMNSRFPECHFF